MTVLKATKENVIHAAQVVKSGGLVVYPTETVYGLGCDPLNVKAIERLLEVKGNRSKPLPVLAASLADVENAVFVTQSAKQLADKFWPGSLTLVLCKQPSFPEIVTFGLNSVGVRIPANHVALDLIGLSGGLLVGSSANLSGEPPPSSVSELSDELKTMVDVVLDGGTTTKGVPSTVVDLSSEKPKLLRQGPIRFEAILDALAFGT